MHRKFAAWLSEKSWRASLFSAIFGMLSPQGVSPIAAFAGAIPVLLVLHREVALGVHAAIAGSVAVAMTQFATGQSLAVVLACVIGIFWIPLGLAMLLRQTTSLNLSFQLGILGAGVVLALMYVGLDDPVGKWQQLLHEASNAMTQAGIIADEKAVVESLDATNWGTYVTLWLLTVLGALFLGRWWQSLLEMPGSFGEEYQELRLGKILGAVSLLVVISALVINKFGYSLPLVDAWVWVAVAGLAFQGLSAAHKLKARGFISRGWLTAMYVLLIVPLSMSLMVILLAGWGLADNWQRTRANST